MFQSQLNINNSSWDRRWVSFSLPSNFCLTVFLFVYKSNSRPSVPPPPPPQLSSNCGSRSPFEASFQWMWTDGWVECLFLFCMPLLMLPFLPQHLPELGGLSHTSPSLSAAQSFHARITAIWAGPYWLYVLRSCSLYEDCHPSTIHVLSVDALPFHAFTFGLLLTPTFSHIIGLKNGVWIQLMEIWRRLS